MAVPGIVTAGGYAVVAGTGAVALKESYAIGSGTNVLLETAFNGDTQAYETTSMMIDLLGMGIVQCGIDNAALGQSRSNKKGVYVKLKDKYYEKKIDNIDKLNDKQLDKVFRCAGTEEVSKALTQMSETDTKRANELSEQFLKARSDELKIDSKIIDVYTDKLDEDAMWGTKSFKAAYDRLGKEQGDDWWKLTQEKREKFALRETDLAELQASKVRQYTSGAQAMDAYGKRYDAGNDYFDHNYKLDEIIDYKD